MFTLFQLAESQLEKRKPSQITLRTALSYVVLFAFTMKITVGVLALQGAFQEHLDLLKKAAQLIDAQQRDPRANEEHISFEFRQVRTEGELQECDSLIIPGGESTAISLVAARNHLLDPLRDFVK